MVAHRVHPRHVQADGTGHFLPGKKPLVVVRIHRQEQLPLAQVVAAHRGVGRLFGPRQTGQQQTSQNGDDRDDDQQFDERERRWRTALLNRTRPEHNQASSSHARIRFDADARVSTDRKLLLDALRATENCFSIEFIVGDFLPAFGGWQALFSGFLGTRAGPPAFCRPKAAPGQDCHGKVR